MRRKYFEFYLLNKKLYPNKNKNFNLTKLLDFFLEKQKEMRDRDDIK